MTTSSILDFPYIKGMTFGFNARKGDFASISTYRSFDMMSESLNIDTVVLPVVAWQKNAQSTVIEHTGTDTPDDWEIEHLIDYAQNKGLRVILKPMVNLSDGTWRAYINFFDRNVPSEPSWGEWFRSYREFILHMAVIAQKTCCSIFSVGCELVQSERREKEWRELIAAVRGVYDGFVTYGTDKYQEDHISWWDDVDLISSSGYYSCSDMSAQMARIEGVVRRFNKPFIFLEAGCPSRAGASDCPNRWEVKTPVNTREQARYYKKLFDTTRSLEWFYGYGLWEWPLSVYSRAQATTDDGYCVYGKEAQDVIRLAYA